MKPKITIEQQINKSINNVLWNGKKYNFNGVDTSDIKESMLDAGKLIEYKRIMDSITRKLRWRAYAHAHAREWSRKARQRLGLNSFRYSIDTSLSPFSVVSINFYS